jgi:hypothetical protein
LGTAVGGSGRSTGTEESETDQDDQDLGSDFHDVLKAKALGLPCPLQLIRRDTWGRRH